MSHELLRQVTVVDELSLEAPGASDTGAYRLAWDGPGRSVYRVVETDPDGTERVLYEGRQTACTVSGRTEGAYSYRVGVVEGGDVREWSARHTVDVDPPSMALALALFSIGAVVCLATVLVVVRGHRAHRRGEIG